MPNQTPEPPRVTDGQIAEWERDLKLARKPSAADECVYARDEIFNVAMPRLLAEVKRLKAENAWQREQMAGIVEGNARGAVAVRTELHRLLDLYDVEANPDVSARILTLGESRAPRTTERL